MMSALKLSGMRSAFDEVLANGLKRRHAVHDIKRARALTNGLIHPLPTAPFVIEGCGPWTTRG